MRKQVDSIPPENHLCLPVVFLARQHPRVAELGGTCRYPFAGQRAPEPRCAKKVNRGYARPLSIVSLHHR